MSIAQASYLTESTGVKRARKPITAFVLATMVAFIAVLSGALSVASPASTPLGQTAQAGGWGIICSDENALGDYMDQGAWDVGIGTPHREATGRTWTAQEAFGNNVNFANYHGEGEAKDRFLVAGVKNDRGKSVSPDAWGANIGKFEELRTLNTCLFRAGINLVSNVGLSFASGVSRIAQVFAVYAFDSGIICPEAGSSNGKCIDLLKVIGGPETAGVSQKGLIGTLTSGVYLPLLVIIVCLSGFWVGYRGIVQRQYREALFGAAWIMLAVIFGLTFLYKPSLLAKAPMAVSNTVAACVVGSYTGNSCWNGGDTGGQVTDPGTDDSRKMCASAASGLGVTDQMSMSVNSLSCSIWEAFVLEPYAQGSFGRSVDELNVNDPVVAAAISKAKVKPDDFCVALGSTKSVDGMGSTLVLDSSTNKVCNLALYQAYLSTNAESMGNKSNQTASTPDTRWYNLILTVASDNGMWEKWSPTGVGDKVFITFIANVAAGLGSIVIVVISFFALLYYLTSVLMIAFAPLFFLVGVHPGRGRGILIGWMEVVLSNVLKYMASAFFLIVTIAFYAAVLGSADNVGLTLLFILVLTGALLLYRKEIVNLIGKVNMGGERLSNKMGQKLENAASRTGKAGLAVAGSAVGAAVSVNPAGNLGAYARNIKEEGLAKGLQHSWKDFKEDANTIKAGAADGLKREMKKGGGLVANATRQYDRISQDNKRDLNQESNTARSKANEGERKLAAVDEERGQLRQNVETAEQAMVTGDITYKAAEKKENERREVDATVRADMDTSFAGFEQMNQILNRLYELKARKHSLAPDDPERAKLDVAIREHEAAGARLMAEHPADTVDMYSRAYQEVRNQRYREAGVTPDAVAAGKIGAADAMMERARISSDLSSSFGEALPTFSRLEATMQRLDALKMERDIAMQAGDIETAESFTVEIDGLERSKNQLRASIDSDVDTALTGRLNNLKDQRYGEAGLEYRTANAAEERSKFVTLAADHKTATTKYDSSLTEYNSNVDKRNELAADVATNVKKADVLEKAVTDMRPGSNMTNRDVRDIKKEAAYQGKQADPADVATRDRVSVSGEATRVMPTDPTLVMAPKTRVDVDDAPSSKADGGLPTALKARPSDTEGGAPALPAAPVKPQGGGSGGAAAPQQPAPQPTILEGEVVPSKAEGVKGPERVETVTKETVVKETVQPSTPSTPVVTPPVVTPVAPQASAPAPKAEGGPEKVTPKETVIRETQVPAQPQTPQPTKAAGVPVTPPAPQNSVREKVTEVVREVPAQQPKASAPQAAAPQQPAPQAQVIREQVVQPATPQKATPSAPAPQAPAPQASPQAPAKGVPTQPQQVVRETVVQQAPAPQAAPAPKEAPAQVIREVPAQTPQPKETIREVRVETPAPAQPKAEPQVIRETVVQQVQVPAEPAKPQEIIRETVKEVPVAAPGITSQGRNMSDDEIRNLIREKGEALSARERATFEETLRTANAAKPNADGSNSSTLQRAAEAARQEKEALVAKMMAAQTASDQRHAAEQRAMEARVAAAERQATQAQDAARQASRQAEEARKGHGLPTAPAANPRQESSSSDAAPRQQESQQGSGSQQQSNSTPAQNQQVTDNDNTQANEQRPADRPGASRSLFGRKKNSPPTPPNAPRS